MLASFFCVRMSQEDLLEFERRIGVPARVVTYMSPPLPQEESLRIIEGRARAVARQGGPVVR